MNHKISLTLQELREISQMLSISVRTISNTTKIYQMLHRISIYVQNARDYDNSKHWLILTDMELYDIYIAATYCVSKGGDPTHPFHSIHETLSDYMKDITTSYVRERCEMDVDKFLFGNNT